MDTAKPRRRATPHASGHPHRALELACQQSSAQAVIRRGLRNGTLTLAEVMADPPVELRGRVLFDVIRMARPRTGRNSPALAMMGRRALDDGINLMVHLGRADVRTRAWAAEYGMLGVGVRRVW